MAGDDKLIIRIICDNEVRSPGLITTNSISMYMNDEILIDACTSPDEIKSNAKALNINLKPRWLIVTTPVNHHWGGLLSLNGIVKTVIMPMDSTWFGVELKGKLEELGMDFIEVNGIERLKTKFGELEIIRVGNKRVGELLLHVPRYKLLISGCGLGMWFIDENELLRFFKGLGVEYFVGGLGATSISEYQGFLLRSLVRDLKGIYPLHGTGPGLRKELVSTMRNVRDVGAGSVISFGD